MYVNPEILELIQKECNSNNFNPESIGLDAQGSTLVITLALKNGAKNNMQKNAFRYKLDTNWFW